MNGARIIEVILVQKGENQEYYTKEGVLIGVVKEGSTEAHLKEVSVDKDSRVPSTTQHPRSAVIKGPTPDKVVIEQARENQEIIQRSAEEKAKVAAEKNIANWQKGKSE